MEYKYFYKENDTPGFLKKNWTFISGIIPWVFTIITVFLSFYSVNDTTKWKKAEFLSKEYQRFITDKSIVNFRMMLYADRRYMEFTTGRPILINRGYISAALDPNNVDASLLIDRDTDKKINFNIDMRVREMTDTYFQFLATFERYIKADVLTIDDVKPYFEGDIQLMTNPLLTKGDNDSLYEFQNSLKKFMNQEKYQETVGFISRFKK